MSEEKSEIIEEGQNDLDPMMFVVPRLEGLMDILDKLGMSSELMLNSQDVPFLTGEKKNGTITYFTYIPFDLENDGQFVLQMSRILKDGNEDIETSLIDIASFNLESGFGFAVQDPISGDIVLRAQVPEKGGVEYEWYEYIFEMFEDACISLLDLLESNDIAEVD